MTWTPKNNVWFHTLSQQWLPSNWSSINLDSQTLALQFIYFFNLYCFIIHCSIQIKNVYRTKMFYWFLFSEDNLLNPYSSVIHLKWCPPSLPYIVTILFKVHIFIDFIWKLRNFPLYFSENFTFQDYNF